MIFNHIESGLPIQKIEQINGEIRTYKIDGEKEYPSITTVLSSQEKPFLKKWKKRVGEKEAERIRNESAEIGTILHESVEQYLQNDFIVSSVFPHIRELFLSIKPHLNKINNIRVQEEILVSDALEIAGTVDCIAEFDGVLSVIDFKNSRRPKKLEWVQDYITQCTFYAMAYFEMTGTKIKQIVLPIAVWDSEPQLFTSAIKTEHMSKLLEIRKNFRLTRGI